MCFQRMPKLQHLDISGNGLDADFHRPTPEDNADELTLRLQPPLRLRDLCVSSTDLFGQGGDEIVALQASWLTRLHVRSRPGASEGLLVEWRDLAAVPNLQEPRHRLPFDDAPIHTSTANASC